MKRNNKYMKFVMEAADDAHLLGFGFPNKIQTYSTLRNWFLKVTSKALMLCSFPTAVIMVMFIVKPKDWPIGEQIASCFIPLIVCMPFAWIMSFMQGYLLPKRVKRRFDEISESAFLGFNQIEINPGCRRLLGQKEEWYLEFYQENSKNMISMQALFKSRIDGRLLSEHDIDEKLKSFCERRNARLKNRPITQYISVSPYSINATLPMRLKLTAFDYRNLYNDLKAFVNSIDSEIVSLDSY